MELFQELSNLDQNLLPRDGVATYREPILSMEVADDSLERLLREIPWQRDEVMMFGKLIVTRRETAWYGDEPFVYTYSRIPRRALPWNSELLELKALVEKETQETFNSCLLNLYHDGSEGMGWHSDDESELKPNGSIASLSLGAERKFAFKHKTTRETVSLMLAHGSLLVMQGATQTHWKHRLPPTKRAGTPRVNLTFRTIVGSA